MIVHVDSEKTTRFDAHLGFSRQRVSKVVIWSLVCRKPVTVAFEQRGTFGMPVTVSIGLPTG